MFAKKKRILDLFVQLVSSFSLQLALRNALRYFPPSHHATLAPEFVQELQQYGHIYMYRFCPTLPMR